MNNKLKCGIVGYGYMGEIRRAVIERHPDLELLGICETNPKVREKVQNCRFFDHFDKLLQEDLDIVFVCTPNKFSPEICIKSLQARKHVFCEKPPGCSVDDVKNIIKHEKLSTKLMFGFNHRFHPGIVRSKVLVDSGALGQIINIRGIYGKSGGLRFRSSWRNDKEMSGGGILLDQGIHMLDLFLYFCGQFNQVKAFLSNRYWQFDVEDNAFVILKNVQDQLAMLHSSATFWQHQFQINITLEKGYLVVKGLLSKTGSYGRETLIIGRQQFEDETEALGNPSEEIIYFDNDRSWDLEVNELVKCIKNDLPVTISSSQDALNVMRVIDLAYKDSQSINGSFVSIQEEK